MRQIKFRAKPHPGYFSPRTNSEKLDVRDGFIFGSPDVRDLDIPNSEKVDNLYSIPTCFVTLNKKGWTVSIPVIEDTIGEFTGLHDKNGKEIYEGDIVRFTKGQKKDSSGNWVDDTDDYVVCFDHGSFSIAGLSHCEDAIEIIGNIYEKTK